MTTKVTTTITLTQATEQPKSCVGEGRDGCPGPHLVYGTPIEGHALNHEPRHLEGNPRALGGMLPDTCGTIGVGRRSTDGEKMQDRHSLYGTAEYWDKQAASFDDEPDHGLTTDRIRAAWSRRLAAWLPERPSTIVDLGCGTGSLSVLAAEAGHETIGVDLSPAMVERAQLKALPLDLPVRFVVGDAASPDLAHGTLDVALVRHVVWALPNTDEALRRWAALLKPDGRLIAIEGRWGSGGITATDLIAALTPLFDQIEHHSLSDDPDLWDKTVDDERYAVIATGPRRSNK